MRAHNWASCNSERRTHSRLWFPIDDEIQTDRPSPRTKQSRVHQIASFSLSPSLSFSFRFIVIVLTISIIATAPVAGTLELDKSGGNWSRWWLCKPRSCAINRYRVALLSCLYLSVLSPLFSPIITSLREKYFFLALVLFPSRDSVVTLFPYCFHRLRNLSSEDEDDIFSVLYKQDTIAAVARFSIKLFLPCSDRGFLSRKTYDCLLPRVYHGTSKPIKVCRSDCQSVFSSPMLASLRRTVIASNFETLIKECHFIDGLTWRRRETRPLSFLRVDVRKKEKKVKRKKRKIADLALSTLTNDRNEPTTWIKGKKRKGVEQQKKVSYKTGSARYKSRSSTV